MAGRFVFRKISVLSQEAERADDRRLLCLSLADGEKADDADNEQDGIADAAGYRNKKGPEKHRADDAEKNVNDRKLERLTDMEACIRRALTAEQGDDNAYRAEQIAQHGDNLVIGNVLRIKFRRMVIRIEMVRRLLPVIRLLPVVLLSPVRLLRIFVRRAAAEAHAAGLTE